MICIVAFAIFAVLGIFSAKYRSLAKESFECVFKMITFKPCESQLDQRIRAKVVGKVFKRNRAMAGFLNRHFEVISWIFVVLMIASTVLSAQAIYNLVVFNNCNGPNTTEACALTALQEGGATSCEAGQGTAIGSNASIGNPTLGESGADTSGEKAE